MAGFFDEEDVIAPVQPVATKPKKPKAGSFFDPADIAPVPANTASSGFFDPEDNPELKKVQETMERPFLSAPLISSEPTTDVEIEALARKNGVDPALAKDLSTYFGAIREEGKRDKLGELESSAARGIGFNIPQFIGKKSIDDPKVRAFIDDLQDLADKKRSFARGLAENVVPVGAAARLFEKGATTAGEQGLKQVLKQGAKEGATIGGVASGARSREGEELKSVATGAVLGAPLGAGASAFGYGISKLFGRELPNAEKQLVEEALQRKGPDIEQGAEQILARKQPSEDMIRDRIINPTEGKRDLSPAGDTHKNETIVKEQLSEDALHKYLDNSNFEGDALRNKLQEKGDLQKLGLRRSVEKELADQVVDERTREFAQYLNRGKSPGNLEEAQEVIAKFRDSKEQIANFWSNYSKERAALEHITKEAIHHTAGDDFLRKTANFFSDNQFVLRDMDERFGGLGAEQTLREINRGLNWMSVPRNEFREQLTKIFKGNKEVDKDLTSEVGGRIARALDSGKLSELSPEELKAAGELQKYFQEGLGFVNSRVKELAGGEKIAPLAIPKRGAYLPHAIADLDQLQARADLKIREAVSDLSKTVGRRIDDLAQLTPEEFSKLSEVKGSPLAQLVEAVRVLDPEAGIKSPRDFSVKVKELFNPQGGGAARVDSMARAALERDAKIPDWMREWNVYKLADKWASNTLKHLYLRNALDKLGSVARKLKAAGGDAEALWINNLRSDILGIRPGTAAEKTLRARSQYLRGIDGLVEQAGGGGTAKVAGAVAKALPDMVSDLTKNVYGNLLGLNPKSIIMNSLQPFVKTAPELGGKYGYGTVLRGYLHTLKNLPTQMQRVEELGFAPQEVIAKYRQVVADGIRRSSPYAMSQEVANRLSDIALKLYVKTDKLNRAVALSTGEMLAADLARGSKGAHEAISKLPTSFQRQLAKSPQGEWGKLLGEYLNDATQYVYNRASMSEYGRVMGPLFSAFTKWPTATAGEIVAEFRKRGLVGGSFRNAEKFIAPLVMLQLLDTLVLEEGREDGLSDRQKKAFGASGLSGSSPLGSVKDIATGKFFTPPAIDLLTKGVLIPALEKNPDKIMKGLDSALYNFTPGTVFVKFLTDDLPTWIRGEKPEGSTFVERTQEGSRIMKKKLGK